MRHRDIIESKARANRTKDRESLPRLRDFATYLKRNPLAQVRALPPQARTTPGDGGSAPPPAERPARREDDRERPPGRGPTR